MNILLKIPFIKNLYERLNDFYERRNWVIKQLNTLQKNSILLDAGCGDQQYREFCKHLIYKGQDFGQYKSDEKKGMASESIFNLKNSNYKDYNYGNLDYVGDIWNIKEKDETFDAILCTEVFEHIPYPIETVKEFYRLLKPNGVLLLTTPSNSLRHQDPYYFYPGFSDRWFEKILSDSHFSIETITPVGDYYSWLAVEMARTSLKNSIFSKIILLPAFLYFICKKKNELSINTLCNGYHVRAKKVV